MPFPSSIRSIAQLCFDFVEGRSRQPLNGAATTEREPADTEDLPMELDAQNDEGCGDAEPELTGRDDGLEHDCRQLLLNLGIEDAGDKVSVRWNPRLRSTAGYAAYPSWRIELNPRLIGFEGQVDRTLKHELAHLVAYHRAGRRRIEPHGEEWRKACADLGIPGEPAHHRLPFPRATMQRNHTYQCPSCHIVVGRVRPFKRATACLACCRKHSGGAFDSRFKFAKVKAQTKD